MKKVWVIYDREIGDLYEYIFYETEEDAEHRAKELKEYGYMVYVEELKRYHEKDDGFIEMAD